MWPKQQLTSTSKFISYVLRHKPESIQITLDEHGWVSIADLISAAQKHGQPLDEAELREVVRTCSKQRFSIDASDTKIRANQGHSIQIDLALEPQKPPAVLYHGTATRFLNSILNQGLLAGSRHHVHMSEAIDTAKSVGLRYGSPVILQIDCDAMVADGYVFFQSENQVWLCDSVPAKYLKQKSDC